MSIRQVVDTDRRMNCVDYYAPPSNRSLDEWAQQLWNAGVRSVQRYLYEGAKGITRAERNALKRAGIAIFYGFEASNSNWRGGYRQGRIDGKRARNLARQLGVPRGCRIYFAVDEDAHGMGMTDTAVAYIRGANAGYALRLGHYGARVYGGVDIVDAVCRGKSPLRSSHGFQSGGWSYGRISTYANLYQFGYTEHIAGVEVDFNHAYNLDGAELSTGVVGRHTSKGA